jgi:hypothetical protein
MESTPNEMIPTIEAIFKKSSLDALKEEDICLIAQAIIDKAPQNPKDLHTAINKWLKSGNNFNKGMKKTFTAILKELVDGGCVGPKKAPKKLDIEDTPSTMHEDEESIQGTPLNRLESPDSHEE